MDSVERLKASAEKLLAETRALRADNARLVARAAAMEARALAAEKKLAAGQNQLTATLLTSSITEVAGGTRAAKLRLSRLIRQIDQCIAMASK
ncbi:MAG: hypothetical protein RR980_00640 [Mucinivorans sp.]